MKFRNKTLVVLLAMTLTSQGRAWDDEQKKDADNKRKVVIAGAIVVSVVATAFGGYKVWRHFDLGKMFKKKVVDGKEYIGIDLGTTNTGGGRGNELIPDTEDKIMTASAVAYNKDGEVLSTGNKALEKNNRIVSAKRAIGMTKSMAKKDNTLKVVADIRKGNEHMAAIETPAGQVVSPEEAATEVLRGVKQRIDKHYGKDFKKAVITVPAYFYEFQKAATKRAAEAVGFDEVVLINEPTAAAFAHGAAELDTKDFKRGVNYLVYDFGGGTMDISIVKAFLNDKEKTFKVNSITGDPRLGGDDIDRKIAKKFAQDLGLDFDSADDATKRVLRQQAEHAKIHLSDANNKVYQSGEVNVSDQYVQVEISIDDFNQEIEDIVNRTIELTAESIDLAKNVDLDDIDEVILVGGSSRNFLVRQKLIELFGKDRLAKSLQGEIDPDEMVAKGAAKYAKVLDTNKDYKLSDIVPIALRVDLHNPDTNKMESVTVIPRFADQPSSGSVGAKIKSNTSEDNPLSLYVRQGNSDTPSENLPIGMPKFKGEFSNGEHVDIVFEIDDEGILNIKVLDKQGKETEALLDMSKTPEDIEEGADALNGLTEDKHHQLVEELRKREIAALENKNYLREEQIKATNCFTEEVGCNTKALERNTEALERNTEAVKELSGQSAANK